MKKAMIAIVSVIYIIAIIIVAFLGVRAEFIRNQERVDATGITLVDMKENVPGEVVNYYFDGSHDEDKILYVAYAKPEHLDDEGYDDDHYNLWRIPDGSGDDYDYIIRIKKWTWLYNYEWRDGKTNFNIHAKVVPDNASEQALVYSTTEGNEGTIYELDNDNGTIHFLSQLENRLTIPLTVSTTDNSGIRIRVKVQIEKSGIN